MSKNISITENNYFLNYSVNYSLCCPAFKYNFSRQSVCGTNDAVDDNNADDNDDHTGCA